MRAPRGKFHRKRKSAQETSSPEIKNTRQREQLTWTTWTPAWIGWAPCRDDLTDLWFERRYPRPVETVWAALTDPARLADWMSPARVQPEVGGCFELFTDRTPPMIGRILAWEPPWLLEFSWSNQDAPNSVVRYELTPEGDGTRLVFTHKGVRFDRMALVLPGWHVYLERLASLLAGAAQPLSMDRWRQLQNLYLDRYKPEGVVLDPTCTG